MRNNKKCHNLNLLLVSTFWLAWALCVPLKIVVRFADRRFKQDFCGDGSNKGIIPCKGYTFISRWHQRMLFRGINHSLYKAIVWISCFGMNFYSDCAICWYYVRSERNEFMKVTFLPSLSLFVTAMPICVLCHKNRILNVLDEFSF
jgi:hypothetical protein